MKISYIYLARAVFDAIRQQYFPDRVDTQIFSPPRSPQVELKPESPDNKGSIRHIHDTLLDNITRLRPQIELLDRRIEDANQPHATFAPGSNKKTIIRDADSRKVECLTELLTAIEQALLDLSHLTLNHPVLALDKEHVKQRIKTLFNIERSLIMITDADLEEVMRPFVSSLHKQDNVIEIPIPLKKEKCSSACMMQCCAAFTAALVGGGATALLVVLDPFSWNLKPSMIGLLIAAATIICIAAALKIYACCTHKKKSDLYVMQEYGSFNKRFPGSVVHYRPEALGRSSVEQKQDAAAQKVAGLTKSQH